ncbi:MAG: hypothetical protein KF850_12005 [Labilithrix sp.]|nr:hypothetical protein [Labilithrix sp.]MBX3212751.1 hypothetical protein [Labilithrix sp.]
MRDSVEATLGRPLFTDRTRADIVLDGEEQRDGTRYRARVTQRDRAGTELGSRELEAETCASLRRMTVVVVTLFVEPAAPRERESPSAPPPPREIGPSRPAATVPAPLTPPRERAPLAQPPSAPARRPRLHLGVGGGAAVGLLPRPSASVRAVARLSLARSRLSFDWSFGYSMPQTVADGFVRASFSAVDQQLRACFAGAHLPQLRVDACGGGLFAAIVPSTRGIAGGEGSARALLGPTTALALRVGKGPAELHIELGLAAPWRRRTPHYVTAAGEIRTLYRTSPIVGVASVTGSFALF